MKTIRTNILLVSAVTLFLFTACSDSGNDGPGVVEAKIASDIPANVNTVIQTQGEPVADVEGDTETSSGYTFFDLNTGSIIDDSLSADWDIAFGGTTILANSGNGGGIQLVQTAYADVETAPETGFEANNKTWFTYTGEAPAGPKHAVIADENETLIIKTSDGNYAKVEILSYYEGNPDTDTPEFANFQTRPAGRHFTFNYALKTNGSTQLYHVDSFTFFDFETGQTVEDSLSSQWDIGIKGTEIIANFGNGGGIQELNIAFAALDEAPTSGYAESNKSWYNYTGRAQSGPQHAVLPKENLTLVLKTPDNLYAKFRVISYYKGNPDVTTPEFIDLSTRPDSRYYTIEYGIQADGSNKFE